LILKVFKCSFVNIVVIMSAQIKCRPTKQQMKLLVDLLAEDPQLMAGKFSSTFTQKIASARWEAIASQLNAMPGAEKTWCKWKKVITI